MSLFTGAIAIATAIAAGGAAKAGADIYSANKQSDSTNSAAADQLKANEDTLAFQKQQAEAAYQSNESTRKANYDQWAAKEGTIAGVAGQHGLSVNIPAYVPSVDPGLNGTIAGATGSSAPPAAPGGSSSGTSANPTDPNAIMAQLQANYKSLGVSPTGQGTGPTDIAYYAQKIADTGGLTPQNSAYWFGPTGRIATDLSKSGAPGGAAPAGSIAATTASLGSQAQPLQGLAQPAVNYGSIRSYIPRM